MAVQRKRLAGSTIFHHDTLCTRLFLRLVFLLCLDNDIVNA